MALEAGTFISDLVVTNPLANDFESQGDDHLRLLKATLKNTFLDTFTAGVYLPKFTSANDALVMRTLMELGSAFFMVNGAFVATVAGNALTIGLKTQNGSDPSATNPVYVAFKNAPAADGNYTVLAVTAVTSLVVSAGSTLGTANNFAFRLIVYGFNDAGVFRLAVSNGRTNANLNESLLLSTTAEGGVGGADSADVIYSAVAVVSKSFRVLGYLAWNAGLPAAGSWSAGPSVAYTGLLPVERPINKVVLQTFLVNGVYVPTLGMKYCWMFAVGGGGGGGGCAAPGAGQQAGGGGGGGGSTGIALRSAQDVGVSQVVTVAAASPGGGPGDVQGTHAGDSSIGVLCKGVGGGQGQGNGSAAGGAAGPAGIGNLTFTGEAGNPGTAAAILTVRLLGGGGGNSGFGMGGGGRDVMSVINRTNGFDGQNYGGGGSGAVADAGFGPFSGGAGSQGVCFVIEFCVS